MKYFKGHRDTETQRSARVDSAGRPALQADAHGGDRIEIRTVEGRSGSYLGPILAVPPRRGARRIASQGAMRLVRAVWFKPFSLCLPVSVAKYVAALK